MRGQRGKVTYTTKVTIYCQIYKRICKVRSGCNCSSARWVISIAGMVELPRPADKPLPRPADKHKHIKLHARRRTTISGYDRN